MDPFSIATGVVGLAQGLVGLVTLVRELRESIEKVSKNRKKAAQLVDDISQTIEVIQAFHAGYSDVFADAQDLERLVSDLRNSLVEIVETCKLMVPDPATGVSREQMFGFQAWLKRGELEERLAKLNRRAQQCQNKFMTLATLKASVTTQKILAATARIETSITSIHQRAAVGRVSKDLRDSDDDSQSCPALRVGEIHLANPASSPKILKSPDIRVSAYDVKSAFLRVQVEDIDKLLSDLLQHPQMSFHVSSPRPDSEYPTHTIYNVMLRTDWESLQHYTAVEATQLIDTIRRANTSISITQIGDRLRHLRHRYNHFGMNYEADVLISLALRVYRSGAGSKNCSDEYRTSLAIALQTWPTHPSYWNVVEATQNMVEAISIYRQLVAENPHPERRIDLAGCLDSSSKLARQLGDLETAEAHSTEALNIILDAVKAPPGAIPDATTFQLTERPGIEHDGILWVEGWQDRVIFAYASVLCGHFDCALARESYADAYQYGYAAWGIYQTIVSRYPTSFRHRLFTIATELLKQWAATWRSVEDTMAFYTNAIDYMSATTLLESGRRTVAETFRLYAIISDALHLHNNLSGALSISYEATVRWDQWSSNCPQSPADPFQLYSLSHNVLRQIRLRQFAHFGATSPFLLRNGDTWPTWISISVGQGQTEQAARGLVSTVALWCRDAHAAWIEDHNHASNTDLLASACSRIAHSFAFLGDFDAARQAASQASGIVTTYFKQSSPKGMWGAVGTAVRALDKLSRACLQFSNEPRCLLWIEEIVALVKTLFPAEEPAFVPYRGVEAVRGVGGILASHSMQLEVLRRMDESLAVCRSNLDWYNLRFSSPAYPTNHLSTGLVLDLARNCIYAGHWSAALSHTTAVVNAVISQGVLPGRSGELQMIDWWDMAFLMHSSILIDLGRVEEAGECIDQAISALTAVSKGEKSQWKWRAPQCLRRARILSLAQEDPLARAACVTQAVLELEDVDESVRLWSFAFRSLYEIRAPGGIYGGRWLDGSIINADIGDHDKAIDAARRVLEMTEYATTQDFNWWQDFALMQLRTDAKIAYAVGFILGGHIQDAAELLPPLFDIYKKELQYQRNLCPGYAIALRLGRWVFDAVRNVAERKKMKKRGALLESLLDEDEDAETLRVIQIRIEMEEGRPAMRRVREILGVEPYEAETSD